MNHYTEAIMISQVVVLYGFAAPQSFRLMRQTFLNKNPAWIAAHPQFARQQIAVRYPLVASLLIGLAWLVDSVRFISSAEMSEPAASSRLLWPMITWLVLEIGIGCLQYHRVWKKIPSPDKRRTTFSPRVLQAYAHPLWLLPAVVMMSGIALTYLLAYLHGELDLPVLLWRLGSLILGSTIWAAALHYAIHRKKQPLDESLGARYRRTDVRATVACLYGFAAIAGFRALQDVFAVFLIPNLVFYTFASLILQLLALFWITFDFSNRPSNAE